VGVDGANINTSGGTITYTVVGGSIQIDTSYAFYGTRSMGLVNSGVPNDVTFPVAVDPNISLRCRFYKLDGVLTTNMVQHGNGTKMIQVYCDDAENLYYYDTAARLMGSFSAGAWHTLEINNINFTAGTFDVYLDSAILQAGAIMRTLNLYNGKWRLQQGVSSGTGFNVDNVIVRNFSTPEPTFGSWGAETVAALTKLIFSGTDSSGPNKLIVSGELNVGNDAYTVSLLQFDGSDGSTTFTDGATGGTHTWSASGNAQIDTAQYKFGQSGLFDGAGDKIVSDYSSDWNLGSGDFTIDGFVRWNALPNINTGNVILGMGDFNTTPYGGYNLWIYNNSGSYEVRFGAYKNDGTVDFQLIYSISTPLLTPGIMWQQYEVQTHYMVLGMEHFQVQLMLLVRLFIIIVIRW